MRVLVAGSTGALGLPTVRRVVETHLLPDGN